MRTLTALAALATPLALGGDHAASPAQVAVAQAPALPPRSALSTRARLLMGPRVMTAETTNRRSLAMYGNTSARSRLLVAGCVNGERCAGTDVVRAAMLGCPPTDAELWYFQTLDPRGADLDASPAHPGAAAWRQAVADLDPRVTLTFRSGPRAVVRPAGGHTEAARRYARFARLPLRPGSASATGLGAWASTLVARPFTASIVVELPGEHVPARLASRLAYAIDRLAGTRFAAGAESERRRLITLGADPRVFWH